MTKPDDVKDTNSKAKEITSLIEAEFKRNPTMDKPDIKSDGRRKKLIRVPGHFPVEDCREVVKAYINIGWKNVVHRRVPHSTEPETTFTFFKD